MSSFNYLDCRRRISAAADVSDSSIDNDDEDLTVTRNEGPSIASSGTLTLALLGNARRRHSDDNFRDGCPQRKRSLESNTTPSKHRTLPGIAWWLPMDIFCSRLVEVVLTNHLQHLGITSRVRPRNTSWKQQQQQQQQQALMPP